MTATLINILPAPAVAEPGVTPGIPAGPAVAAQPGDPQSFTAAMQALGNPHGDGGSGSVLPPDLAVTESKSTVPATVPDLALPALPDAPLTGEQIMELPDEAVSFDRTAGSPLPEIGPETGNILPLVTGHQGPQPAAPSDSAAPAMTANTLVPRQAANDPAQMAVTNILPRPMMSTSQLNPDAGAPAPIMNIVEEPSALMPQANAGLESALQGGNSPDSGQAQRAFKAMMMMHTETPVASRVAADIATITGDSGPVGFAQSTSQAPLQFDQLMELPQFQNMRPLQPTADPKTFMESLGQRLMVMSEEGVQSARMKLYPENLGTLDVRIRVEDDTARVWFTAQPGQARDALEAALPKLKELFAQQGLELLQADVGSDRDRNGASEAFDRTDDLFPRPVDSEPDYPNEPIGHPNMLALSERSLDIYV